MCVVSAVTDHYQKEWGKPWELWEDTFPGNGWQPNPSIPVFPIQPFIVASGASKVITQEQWEEYQRLKKAAQEIDEKTGQPDCIKPELDEWETKMKALLVKLGVIKE